MQAPAAYLPPAERTGKSLVSEMPPSNVSVTGTELPGFIDSAGDMHIRW